MIAYFLLFGIFARIEVSTFTNSEKVVLDFSIPEFEQNPDQSGCFMHIYIQDAGIASNVGKPQLPVIREFVEVPEEANLSVEAKVIKSETRLLKYPIYPYQPPVPKNGYRLSVIGYQVSDSRGQTPPKQDIVIDQNYYLKDEFLPENRVSIIYIGKIRGHRIAVVEIYPLTYNPRGNIINFVSQIQVTIKFCNPDWDKTISNLKQYSVSPYEDWLKNIVVNYDYFSKYTMLPLPIGYLIITPDEWYEHILPFARWKRQKGFYTKIAKLSQTGYDVDEIRTFIQNAYNTWTIPPTYVLLIGDIDKIGYFTGEGLDNPSTDLNFSLMEDTDYFPDVYVSRFSVADTFQLDSLVAKTVKYERNNWSYGEEWCKKAYFIASSDGGNHQIAESTHTYCMEKCRAHGMICDSLWLFSSSGTEIFTALNEGRTFVMYSGHGGTTSWQDPGFGVNDVHNLANIDRIPFVASFACYSGDYASYFNDVCFSEAWNRVGYRGAIAHLASSVSSYWDEDDYFQRRLFDAMFDSGTTWIMGAVNYAKMKFYQYYGNIDTTLGYFEMYNLMGDGSIDVYSNKPESLVVEYPDSIPIDDSLHISVKHGANPVESALVCAQTDTIYTGYTDENGNLALNITTAQRCTVRLTATGHNLGTYEGHTIAYGIEETEIRSEEVRLFQNYPNPFMQKTVISYQLPVISKNSRLTPYALQIYDLSGRLVKSFPLTTNHFIGLSGSRYGGTLLITGLKSGIYFYTLKIGKTTFTKKMVML